MLTAPLHKLKLHWGRWEITSFSAFPNHGTALHFWFIGLSLSPSAECMAQCHESDTCSTVSGFRESERAHYAKDLCSLAVASPRLFIIPFVSKSLIPLLRNLGDVPVDMRPIILLNKIQRRQYAAAAGLSHLTHYLHFRLSSIQQIVRSRAVGFEFRALAPLGHPTGSLSDSERASRIIQQHEIR